MKRSPRRDQWRQTKNGSWTRSLGHRGARVRLFQKTKDGVFYREVHVPDAGRDQACLHTRDRAEAQRLGEALLAALLDKERPPAPRADPPVLLGDLVARYQRECPMYLDNDEHSRRTAVSHAAVLVGFFGADFDVRRLTVNDTTRFATKRRAGGIAYTAADGTEKVTEPVRQRSVHAGLSLLRTLLLWACTVPTADQGRWLRRNPLEGVRFEREQSPKRSTATWDQYEATRTAVEKLAAEGGTDAERLKWIRLQFALWLAEALGRRRGSIVGLRWEDIDLGRRVIVWRAESDKKGKRWVSPLSDDHVVRLEQFRQALGGAAGPVFPRAGDPTRPVPPEMLSQWLLDAERAGGIEKLDGSLWHAYRRKWASERMHHPIKAVAQAGGWSDVGTLISCYQQPDEEAVLAVLNEARKRRDRGAAGSDVVDP